MGIFTDSAVTLVPVFAKEFKLLNIDMSGRSKIRYTKQVKEDAVRSIVDGKLFLEEVMLKYEISDRKLLIRWLRKFIKESKDNNSNIATETETLKKKS